MLVKTGEDKLAHIRKPGMEKTWCGMPIIIGGSTRNCEICDRCLDALIRVDQEKADNRQLKCAVV